MSGACDCLPNSEKGMEIMEDDGGDVMQRFREFTRGTRSEGGRPDPWNLEALFAEMESARTTPLRNTFWSEAAPLDLAPSCRTCKATFRIGFDRAVRTSIPLDWWPCAGPLIQMMPSMERCHRHAALILMGETGERMLRDRSSCSTGPDQQMLRNNGRWAN